jgi:hypothetical protein
MPRGPTEDCADYDRRIRNELDNLFGWLGRCGLVRSFVFWPAIEQAPSSAKLGTITSSNELPSKGGRRFQKLASTTRRLP